MDQDTRVIRASIERDRANIAETIEALTRRGDLKERVRESVLDVAPEAVRPQMQSLATYVRGNPLPVLVALAFLAGLLVGRRGRSK